MQCQRCWKNAVGVLACIDNIPVCHSLHCDVNQIDVPHIGDAWLQLEEGSPGAHAYSASLQLSFEYEYEKEFI